MCYQCNICVINVRCVQSIFSFLSVKLTNILMNRAMFIGSFYSFFVFVVFFVKDKIECLVIAASLQQ